MCQRYPDPTVTAATPLSPLIMDQWLLERLCSTSWEEMASIICWGCEEMSSFIASAIFGVSLCMSLSRKRNKSITRVRGVCFCWHKGQYDREGKASSSGWIYCSGEEVWRGASFLTSITAFDTTPSQSSPSWTVDLKKVDKRAKKQQKK